MRKSLAIAIGLAALVPTVSKAQERAYVYSGAACVYQLQFRTVPDTGDTLGFTGAGGARQGGAVRGIVQGGGTGRRQSTPPQGTVARGSGADGRGSGAGAGGTATAEPGGEVRRLQAGRVNAVGALSSLESSLFAAERVIQYQDRLGLNESQRRDVGAIVDALRAESEPLQKSLQAEQAKLTQLLEQRPIGTTAAMAQLNQLLALEASVKTKHFEALVQIKNILTDAQVEQLNQLLGRCD